MNEIDVKPINVLLIEDSKAYCYVVREMLDKERNPFHLESVHSLKAGLEHLRSDGAAIVLLDLNLPDSRGLDTLRKVHTQALDIPIIILTAMEDEALTLQAMREGAQEYLLKFDVSPAMLSLAIHHSVERKAMEQALQTGLAFRKMVEQNADAIIVIDHSGIVQIANPATETLLGRKTEDLIGTEVGFPLTNDEATEIDIISRSGELAVAEMRAVEIEWAGKPAHLVSMRDVTERKQAETATKEANEELKRLDQLKSDFVATASYELRTPIAIIREAVALCLDGTTGAVTDTQRELLMDALGNTDHLSRLTTDLLDGSKIESGKMRLEKSSVDLCEIVEKAYCSFEKQAAENDTRLKKNIPQQALMLYADGGKIMQIFSNLISNALRFTEPGGEIRINVEEKGDVVECSVSDTGIGITEKDMPRLFSKFEQIDRVEGPGYRETGLGLVITKELVEKHGGEIRVESQVDKGTTFWFTLKNIPCPKILIVDDDEVIVNLVSDSLKRHAYQLIKAYDGNAAVERAKNEAPSLLILDMNLPGMSGYEVIGRLKQDTRTHDLPILIISGAVDEQRLSEMDIHTCIPIINKPFEADELENKVKEMLNY